jgi:hypothetical protein
VATEFSCFALVFLGPIVSLLFFLLDLGMFVWHYRGLRVLYPACGPLVLLHLHLARSNAHSTDLEFSWTGGASLLRVDPES